MSGMSYLGDGSATSESVGDVDFDMSLLPEFQFQADGMPKLIDDTNAATTKAKPSADETSSSDDTGASPESPVFARAPQSTGSDDMTDRKAKRRAQVAVSARRHRYRKKHEMLDLRNEVENLTEQLHSLRCKHKLLRSDGAVEAEEYAMAQRHKRRQAEKMNEQLRRALVMQRRFFTTMKSFVLDSPITNAGLNMSSLLHTYTHLGCTEYARRRDYLEMCRGSKADLAVQILLRETEGVNFAGQQSIVTSSVPALNEQQQIVTTVAAYAFDFLDLKSAFVTACDAILGCGTEWPQYTTMSTNGEVLDKPQGHISYAKTNTSYQSNPAADTQIQHVLVESRSLLFYRMSDNYGVLVWDFADQDDLHPIKPETTIKRDLVGAAMLRRELCHDGIERVVYRSICTKLQSYSLPPTTPEISNYLQNSEEGAKACGYSVFNHIRRHTSEASTSMISV